MPRKPAPAISLHRQPAAAEREVLVSQVRSRLDEIVERYAAGESLSQIAASLRLGLTGLKLRFILLNTRDMEMAYRSSVAERAHTLVEESVLHGKTAAAIGDAAGLRVAIDTNLKVASKLLPSTYGDTSKLELTGAGGGSLKIDVDVTLTPDEAYARMVSGK
jgi:hypothetical protein